MNSTAMITALQNELPDVLRWSGAIARRLREHNIAVEGKISGSSNTDALTLADLTIQELVVAALRDRNPIFQKCKIEAEETTGDLERFHHDSELIISLDPIDGTKQYRDRTGNGYAVMLHLRNAETVLYSLVYIPETGAQGTWVEARENEIRCGADDWNQSAREAIDSLPKITKESYLQQDFDSRKIYMIGFQDQDPFKAQLVSEQTSLQGVIADETPGSIYELLSTGAFRGSLIHSPNVYDFPVALQIARLLGGDALWVHNRQSVHFQETWNDERADMLRLPGVVACSPYSDVLDELCDVAQDWNPVRYAE